MINNIETQDMAILNQEIKDNMDKVYSYLSKLVYLRYHLLIYKLIKKGYVRMKHLTDATGYTRQRLYQIIDTFKEKGENEKI